MAEKRKNFIRPEIGTIRRFTTSGIKVALVYPNRYTVGMSSLGFQTVYTLFNRLPGVSCERAFYPEPDRSGDAGIRTYESKRPLSDADVVAFSVSFENDYPNLLSILYMARLPLRSTERSHPHPLVVAGGVATFLNPEPLAPFIDCFLIGEAEETAAVFFSCLADFNRDALNDRKAFLLRVAREVPGAYVPSFYMPAYGQDGIIENFRPVADVPDKVRRVYVPDLSGNAARSAILTPDTAFGKTFLVEVGRGCTHGCRFCAAGYVYRPPRFQSLASLKDSLRKAKTLTGRIGLVGATVSDHPFIEPICADVLNQGMEAGFSSLRADGLTESMLALLKKSKTKTATLAPDAGSERMRTVINKGITEDQILDAARILIENDIQNLKLYFMVGLPTERSDDINAIVRLCKQIKDRFLKSSRPKGRMGIITVSLSSFVPKPFTPFQWSPMDPADALRDKIRKIKAALGKVSNVRVHADVPRWALIQGLLSLGDRRVSDILVSVHENRGNWPQTLKTAPVNPGFYLHRQKDLDERLPWDFIDCGVEKAFLKKEFKRAMEGKPSPPCPVESCRVCGVC